MIRSLYLSFLLALPVAATAPADLPTQANYPVIAVGEVQRLDVRIPEYAGSDRGFVSYTVVVNGLQKLATGYRALSIECPPGFLSNLYSENRGGVCYRTDSGPHPAGMMHLMLYNEDAIDGPTVIAEGLGFIDLTVPGGEHRPLHLFGVRP